MLSRHGQRTRFKHLLFFSGKMNFKWGKSYSLGVRAAVWHRWHNDSRFLIHAFDHGVKEKLPLARVLLPSSVLTQYVAASGLFCRKLRGATSSGGEDAAEVD